MSDRRTYNSLIFLTSLSVYLGLVLVGSCPSVLAQAATTKDYDIRVEAVLEDDLDKKPEDDSTVSERDFESYFDSLESFVTELRALAKAGDISFDKHTFDLTSRQSAECTTECEMCSVSKTIAGTAVNPKSNDVLRSAVLDISLPVRLADCGKTLKGEFPRQASSAIRVVFDGKEIRFSSAGTKFNKQRAAQMSAALARVAAPATAAAADASLRTKLRLATKVTAENNQIFIVTRLPRANLN